MKNLLYIVAACLFLTSCGGTEEYDAYVSSLKMQPAVIDTISTGLQIQDALVKTYDRLAQTPVMIPDSLEVPE